MIKFTSNNDFDFAVESVSILRDVAKDLVKRASAKELLQFEKTPHQEDLHIIALGAYEGTGFNRNGDAFSEADCIKNHHYFKDSGRAVHRHHKNKPSDPKYGNIKAAAYNHAMKRIELVVGLDRDKCADILDEQERTGNTNWSMASKQAWDECSWCGHKAKTDKDRCKCIPAHLGEINKQGQMCGMHNPNPRWFEISHVKRGADRIGLALGKLAEDSRIRPMLPTDYLNLYGDIYVPEELTISKKASDKRGLLKKLAEIEKHVDAVAHGAVTSNKDKFIKQHAHKINKSAPVEPKAMDDLRKHTPGPALKSLADNGVIFSPEDFMKYLLGDRAPEGVTKGMKSHLPDAFSSLENNSDGTVVNNEKYEPEGKATPDLKSLSGKLKENHSLESGPAARRIMMITISIGSKEGLKGSDETPKSKEAADKLLAEEYCAYKLAALNYLDEQGKLDEDLLLNAVLQNR